MTAAHKQVRLFFCLQPTTRLDCSFDCSPQTEQSGDLALYYNHRTRIRQTGDLILVIIHRAIKGQTGNLILVDFTTAREQNKLTITLTLVNITAAQKQNKVVIFLWITQHTNRTSWRSHFGYLDHSTRTGQTSDPILVILTTVQEHDKLLI